MDKTTPQLNVTERGVVKAGEPLAAPRQLIAVKSDKRVDAANRKAWFTASTNQVDRYDEVVLPAAFRERIAPFMRHPTFLADHDGRKPIGTFFELTIEQAKVTCGAVYNKTALGEEKWTIAADPTQSVAVSIGFRVVEWIRGTVGELGKLYPELAASFATAGKTAEDRMLVYTKIELLEISQVGVPANSDAVQLQHESHESQPNHTNTEAVLLAVQAAVRNPQSEIAAAVREAVQTAMKAAAGDPQSAIGQLRDELDEMKLLLAGEPGALEREDDASSTKSDPASASRAGASDWLADGSLQKTARDVRGR